MNYKIVGDERERSFLALIRLGQQTADLPSVPLPDRHLDAEEGQLVVCGKRFDFAWLSGTLVELDGGQRSPGGGRHNRDADRWKTLCAQARGWRVLHVSYTMLQSDPVRVLEILRDVLEGAWEENNT